MEATQTDINAATDMVIDMMTDEFMYDMNCDEETAYYLAVDYASGLDEQTILMQAGLA